MPNRSLTVHQMSRTTTTLALNLLVLLVLPAYGDDSSQDATTEYHSIIQSQQAERNLISSVELTYLYTAKTISKSEPDMPELRLQIDYGAEGDKFFQREKRLDVSGLPDVEVAYNGVIARRRDANSRDGNKFVAQGRNELQRAHTSPTPEEMTQFIAPAYILQKLRNGDAKAVKVETGELDNMPVTILTLQCQENDVPLDVTEWLSSREAYWPVKATMSVHGKVREQISKVTIGKFHSSGNEFYYPVAATRTVYNEDGTIWVDSFQVEGPVKINEEISNDKFTIVPAPDESLFDSDLNLQIIDRGKGVNLDRSTSIVPSTSVVGDSKSASFSGKGGMVTSGNQSYSVWRVTAFVAAILLLLAAAFFWRRGTSPKRRTGV